MQDGVPVGSRWSRVASYEEVHVDPRHFRRLDVHLPMEGDELAEMVRLLERYLEQGVPEGVGPFLPFRLHDAFEVLVRQVLKERLLLRDNFLHVLSENTHSPDL